MKGITVLAVSAAVATLSLDSVAGYATYLKEIPNGDLFKKALGHTADDDYTDFGKAYSAAGGWNAGLCKAFYPGTSITNGAAFGDPCCTWKKGATPDKTVTPWTDKPTIATVCAASSPAVTPAPAVTTATPSATSAPATGSTTSAPATSTTPGTSSTTTAPSSSTSTITTAPATGTTAPSTGSAATPSPTKAASNNLRKCTLVEPKKMDDDSDEKDDSHEEEHDSHEAEHGSHEEEHDNHDH